MICVPEREKKVLTYNCNGRTISKEKHPLLLICLKKRKDYLHVYTKEINYPNSFKKQGDKKAKYPQAPQTFLRAPPTSPAMRFCQSCAVGWLSVWSVRSGFYRPFPGFIEPAVIFWILPGPWPMPDLWIIGRKPAVWAAR